MLKLALLTRHENMMVQPGGGVMREWFRNLSGHARGRREAYHYMLMRHRIDTPGADQELSRCHGKDAWEPATRSSRVKGSERESGSSLEKH